MTTVGISWLMVIWNKSPNRKLRNLASEAMGDFIGRFIKNHPTTATRFRSEIAHKQKQKNIVQIKHNKDKLN